MGTDTTGWDSKSWDTPKDILLDSDGVYKVNYYLKELTDPADSSSTIYELHGNYYAWGVDISSWSDGDEMSADLGFYYDENQKVDWSQINMSYGGASDSTLTTWSCKDGTSTDASSFTFTEDSTSNCMANTDKSQVQLSGDSGFFVGHWMRRFSTGDMTDDVMLMLDKPLYASF